MTLAEIKKRFASQGILKPDFIEQMHQVHEVLFDYAALLPTTDIAKIEIKDGEVVMTSRQHGISIVCDKDDKRIVPIEILNFGNYEKTDADMICRLVPNGAHVLDIGANVGWYSILLGKRSPSNQIWAFEPIPKTHAYLEKNLSLNSIKNVKAHRLGFSDKEADLKFYYYAGGSGNASSAKLAEGEALEEIACHVQPLDAFMQGKDFSIDFIKCDVEGAELMVFKGARQTLEKHQPIVFSEMLRKWSAKFSYHPNEIIALFSGLGYRCFTAEGAVLKEFMTMTDESTQTNFFFLHAQKHAGLIQSLGSAGR
jgi:FkbM family methyltransferase